MTLLEPGNPSQPRRTRPRDHIPGGCCGSSVVLPREARGRGTWSLEFEGVEMPCHDSCHAARPGVLIDGSPSVRSPTLRTVHREPGFELWPPACRTGSPCSCFRPVGQRLLSLERQDGLYPQRGEHFELNEMDGDHVLPWSRGGKTTAENCQMLCVRDNRSRRRYPAGHRA